MAAQATKNREQTRTNNSSSAQGDLEERVGDLTQYLRDYAKKNPETAALWCLGIGFVLGWKLKPW